MSTEPLFIPSTPASPEETELEREYRLNEEFEAAQEAARPQLLEEFVAVQDAEKGRAVAAAKAKDHPSPRKEKGKGKVVGEESSDLTDERYDREMRSNGTVAQQEEWRSMGHEVRGAPFSFDVPADPPFFRLVTPARTGSRRVRPARP